MPKSFSESMRKVLLNSKRKSVIKLDRRTKNLVGRLRPGDIAVIDHEDLDLVSAESLAEKKIEAVINIKPFTSGKYPNSGPLVLLKAGVKLYESTVDFFGQVEEGKEAWIKQDTLIVEGKPVCSLKRITRRLLEEKRKEAIKKVGSELRSFAENTLLYARREWEVFFDRLELPSLKTQISNRHCLIVVRGYDYKRDLLALRGYIRDVKPVLIGVDGGADALREMGFKPDLIVGDMDSVGDAALEEAPEILVHAYPDGRSPGLERIKRLGLEEKTLILSFPGTSEDLALLLAYEAGAELIVAVGTHFNLVEFLDKGRKGMASTFLTRLKVGEKLVDAKGVSKLYQTRVRVGYFLAMSLSMLVVVSAVLFVSPWAQSFFRLLATKLRLFLFSLGG